MEGDSRGQGEGGGLSAQPVCGEEARRGQRHVHTVDLVDLVDLRMFSCGRHHSSLRAVDFPPDPHLTHPPSPVTPLHSAPPSLSFPKTSIAATAESPLAAATKAVDPLSSDPPLPLPLPKTSIAATAASPLAAAASAAEAAAAVRREELLRELAPTTMDPFPEVRSC